jgi:hypothetical protein
MRGPFEKFYLIKQRICDNHPLNGMKMSITECAINCLGDDACVVMKNTYE